jgi:hypothetical protein
MQLNHSCAGESQHHLSTKQKGGQQQPMHVHTSRLPCSARAMCSRHQHSAQEMSRLQSQLSLHQSFCCPQASTSKVGQKNVHIRSCTPSCIYSSISSFFFPALLREVTAGAVATAPISRSQGVVGTQDWCTKGHNSEALYSLRHCAPIVRNCWCTADF